MKPFSLNIRGTLHRFDTPSVMGIINITPDSFHADSRAADAADAAARAASMVAAGARFIDVGACSTRPGSESVSADEENARLERCLPAVVRAVAGRAIVSVDTFRADVARNAVEKWGADMINDISGGNIDPAMFDTVADLHVPYVLSHMRGTPKDMQEYALYEDVTADVLSELGDRLQQLALSGVSDIIIDPGFGFSKILEQNYQLLARLDLLQLLHRPVLVGMSRKSMATRLLDIPAADALNATTALNTLALDRQAAIIRVHDVEPAVQAVRIYNAMAAQRH